MALEILAHDRSTERNEREKQKKREKQNKREAETDQHLHRLTAPEEPVRLYLREPDLLRQRFLRAVRSGGQNEANRLHLVLRVAVLEGRARLDRIAKQAVMAREQSRRFGNVVDFSLKRRHERGPSRAGADHHWLILRQPQDTRYFGSSNTPSLPSTARTIASRFGACFAIVPSIDALGMSMLSAKNQRFPPALRPADEPAKIARVALDRAPAGLAVQHVTRRAGP